MMIIFSAMGRRVALRYQCLTLTHAWDTLQDNKGVQILEASQCAG